MRVFIVSTILLFLFSFLSCKKNTDDISEGTLERTHVYSLPFPEPSGLDFGPGKTSLLTVSDTTNKIYEINFEGAVIRSFSYTGHDLEGITYNPDKNLIAVVEEKDRKVVLIDYDSGDVQGSFNVEVPVGDEKNGLEGISYHSKNKQYYIVNEKNPGLLLAWTPELGIISEKSLAFAKDYSGIYTDVENSLIWILSDESEALFKCDTNANILTTFNPIGPKYEGVVVDGNTVYFVNDASGTLSIFTIKIK